MGAVASGVGNNGNGALESSRLIRAVRRSGSLLTGSRLVASWLSNRGLLNAGASGIRAAANGHVDSGSRGGDGLLDSDSRASTVTAASVSTTAAATSVSTIASSWARGMSSGDSDSAGDLGGCSCGGGLVGTSGISSCLGARNSDGLLDGDGNNGGGDGGTRASSKSHGHGLGGDNRSDLGSHAGLGHGLDGRGIGGTSWLNSRCNLGWRQS